MGFKKNKKEAPKPEWFNELVFMYSSSEHGESDVRIPPEDEHFVKNVHDRIEKIKVMNVNVNGSKYILYRFIW